MFTAEDPAPGRAKRLGELFDPDGCKAHAGEPCHALVLRLTGWGDGVDRVEVCVDPRRHTPSRVGTDGGSDLATDRTPTRHGTGDDSHAKRAGRLARLAHASEVFAKTRGGFGQAELTRAGLRGLICEAGRDAVVFAATMLGHDQPRDLTVQALLDGVDTPAALARVAGAVALGQAESRMYWSPGSEQCRDYLALLTGSGWTPDDWTAAALHATGDELDAELDPDRASTPDVSGDDGHGDLDDEDAPDAS